MTEFGSATLAAARSGRRNRGRRRLGLAASVLAHVGAAVMLAYARPPQEPPPAPPPEPVLLRLAPPRAPSAPAEPPRPVKPPPRRRPVTQPPPVLPPPVEAPPEEPPPEPEAEEPSGESPDSDAAGPPPPFTGVSGDAIHQLKEVARPPSVLQQVVPEYPRAARSERIVGLVVLRVVVGMDGRAEPERTVVVRSVPGLDAAAIAAIHRWRFSPAIGHSGRPVRVVIEVPFQFSLR